MAHRRGNSRSTLRLARDHAQMQNVEARTHMSPEGTCACERARARERKRERVCVCVCVCVNLRSRVSLTCDDCVCSAHGLEMRGCPDRKQLSALTQPCPKGRKSHISRGHVLLPCVLFRAGSWAPGSHPTGQVSHPPGGLRLRAFKPQEVCWTRTRTVRCPVSLETARTPRCPLSPGLGACLDEPSCVTQFRHTSVRGSLTLCHLGHHLGFGSSWDMLHVGGPLNAPTSCHHLGNVDTCPTGAGWALRKVSTVQVGTNHGFSAFNSNAEEKKRTRHHVQQLNRDPTHVAGGSTINFLADLVVMSSRTDASDLGMLECARNPLGTFLSHT